jgi:HK97 family phage portal protein
MGFWTNLFGGRDTNYTGETPNPANPAGPVGDAAATGDSEGAVLVDDSEDRAFMPLPWLAPTPWSGWPDQWSTPNWSIGAGGAGGMPGFPGISRLIDTAWAAIDLNSSVLSSFPVYRLRNGQVLPSLPYMTNPDPLIYTGWDEFMKQVFWDYQLGEAFVLCMARGANDKPVRFRVIPPWLMSVSMDEGKRTYSLGALDRGGIDVTDDVLHIRYMSNTAYPHGFGPLQAAGARMVTAGLLQRYANKLAETGGIPHHWLDVPGRKLNLEEGFELIDQWVESRLRHAGGPSVLSGGVKLEQAASMNARDLALLELAQFTESRVAVLCGVPPFLLGLPMAQGESITYSNAGMLFDYHDRSSLRPKANAVMNAFSGWLLPWGQSVELNREEYSKPGMLERAQANQIYLGTGVLTVPEVRAMERFDGVPSATAALTGAEIAGELEPPSPPQPEPAPPAPAQPALTEGP